jgi:hypothetical protein
VNCDITRKLYIRANGDIPCYDDAGDRTILGQVSTAEDWSIQSVFGNASYGHVRGCLSQGRTPWPDLCKTCAVFRPNENFSDSVASRIIKQLLIEPSLACSLRCPACSQFDQIRHRPKPFRMPPELFRAALRSLRRERYDVREIEYCGQGEPLNQPRLREFVALGREYFPSAPQRLVTNGNFDYERLLGGTAIDEIYVSCDGLYQHSYAQYRVGGDVNRVLQFMADIPKEVDGRRQKVVWKYIVFEFNDSDAELCAAQEKAVDLGVDCLLFVFTQTKYKSTRYTLANAADFPVRAPNVAMNGTPLHYRYSKSFSPLNGTRWPALAKLHWPRGSALRDCVFVLDDFSQLTQTEFTLRGWALAKEPIAQIQFRRNGHCLGIARLGLPRPDVQAAHPAYGDPASGYELKWSEQEAAAGPQTIEAIVTGAGEKVLGRFEKVFS